MHYYRKEERDLGRYNSRGRVAQFLARFEERKRIEREIQNDYW